MRSLRDVYESARSSIPLRRFPERDSIQPWDGLYDVVRSELEAVHAKTLSVVADDTRLLANHHRVIREFNRGVREGYLEDFQPEGAEPTTTPDSKGPFHWGVLVGRRARAHFGGDQQELKQFLTASHLLEYEFGQLDDAYKRPFEFMLRSLGPEHRDEYRELAFSLPVILNYLRPFVEQLVHEHSFDFIGHHTAIPGAPTHLEYLEHMVAALFDPDPMSWMRVSVFARLATAPFKDGQSLQSEHFLAPEQAVAEVARTPIAARTLVRRQVERMELANSWIGTIDHTLDARLDETRPATLWDAYQLSEASRIQGGSDDFCDLLAGTVILSLSEQIEAGIEPGQTRLEFMRRCYPAFVRGFDARYECVVHPRFLSWVARGRTMSDGLRRFPDGGLYIGGVATRLAQLAATINELRHCIEDPVEFVCTRLKKTRETVVAGQLLDLLDTNPGLANDLFGTNAAFQFSSRATIQTYDCHDLMRSALFHVVHAARPNIEKEDERETLLERGRAFLTQLITAGEQRLLVREERQPGASTERDRALVESGKLLDQNFDPLVRVVAALLRPLHLARLLDTRPYDYLNAGGIRGEDSNRSAGTRG